MSATCPIDYYGATPAGPSLFAPAVEQRWLMQYLPLVKRIVRQLSLQANQVLDREDMEQIGLMGLLEALRRYGTPDNGFGSYASLRVRGAILDELLQSGHEHFPDTAELFEERLIKERVLAQALARLDERERLVLTLYYQHELSLKEIALVLEVSDARVCQLSKQAIGKACRFLTERSQ